MSGDQEPSPNQGPNADEQQAMRRYGLMNAVRFGSVIAVMVGIAMIRGVIEGFPGPLGYIVSAAGALGFFFGPYWLVRHWKRHEK